MQLYAFDLNGKIISSREASKHQDYQCLECRSAVRLRGGLHRQSHFFHLQPNGHCRQNGKSMIHLQVQCYLQRLLPEGQCQLEKPFPSIRRIADVAWTTEKIIFEVQYSPITAQEVKQRNQDYASVGFHVVWILHDQRFNKIRYSAAELFLQSSPFYFTNINSQGKGSIYDQFDILHQGLRHYSLRTSWVNLLSPKQTPAALPEIELPSKLDLRLNSWPLFFPNDLVDLFFRSTTCAEASKIIQKIRDLEAEHNAKINPTKNRQVSLSLLTKYVFQRFVIRPYHIFFQMLLEKLCQ